MYRVRKKPIQKAEAQGSKLRASFKYRSEQSSDSQPYNTALPPKNFNGRHSKFRKLKPWLAD